MMRRKHRYVLVRSSDDSLEPIRTRYSEKFGSEDLQKADLKFILRKDSLIILRCSLQCHPHLLEALSLMNGKYVSLKTSGTLKGLYAKMDQGRVINPENKT